MQAVQSLHSLHKHLVGLQIAIEFLGTITNYLCLISEGTKSQILRPKEAIVSVPLNTNLTWGHLKQDL